MRRLHDFFTNLLEHLWMVALAFLIGIVLLLPIAIGVAIGNHIFHQNAVSHEHLHAYTTAVSNRLDKIEFGLSLLAIPVQRKEPNND